MEASQMSEFSLFHVLEELSGPFSSPLITPPAESAELATLLCGVIALYSVIRIIFEPDVMRKLPFLNVFSFSISGIIALMIPHPLGVIAAAAYFIGSTFESNAIASTWAGGVEE
jgi:energy-converting hydrogenase A subunit C